MRPREGSLFFVGRSYSLIEIFNRSVFVIPNECEESTRYSFCVFVRSLVAFGSVGMTAIIIHF